MKRIQEYQMLLNASKIPYLEKKKSYLCESNCNSPENVAEITREVVLLVFLRLAEVLLLKAFFQPEKF